MVLSDKQWDGLGRMLGGNTEYVNSLTGRSYITLARLSVVQDSYLLTYSNWHPSDDNNIEIEIHRYSHISKYDLSILHTLWNLWATEQIVKNEVNNELDRILQGNHPSN